MPRSGGLLNPSACGAAAEACGDVSILVNNAGVFRNVLLMGAPDIEAAREESEARRWPKGMSRPIWSMR